MSASDSDLSTPANLPSNKAIEQCLRRVVQDALKKEEEITMRQARSRAENELGLDDGFLKDNAEWKTKSKEIVTAAIEDPLPPSPKSTEKPKPKAKAKPAPKAKPAAKAGTKRKSEDAQPKKKRQKKEAISDDEDDISEVSAVESDDDFEEEDVKPKPAKKSVQKRKSAIPSDDEEDDDVVEDKPTKDEDSSVLSDAPETTTENQSSRATPSTTAPAGDESDYSDVRDSPPPKKKQRQTKAKSPQTSKSTKGKPVKAAATASKSDISPAEEEVKRLQGWLLKCGVRKLWHRELAHCDTPQAKQKHLKRMLEEIGMTGRYSAEKAKSIKESRELAAEIEAAKEFEAQFGHKGSDDESGDNSGGEKSDASGTKGGQPKRRLPKGLVDFGDSGDDESD